MLKIKPIQHMFSVLSTPSKLHNIDNNSSRNIQDVGFKLHKHAYFQIFKHPFFSVILSRSILCNV